MIQTVIFDLDGLLADTESNWYKVSRDFVKQYGGTLTLESYVQNNGGKTIIDNAAIYIRDHQIPLTVEEGVELLVAAEMRNVEKGVPLKKGAMVLLTYLKDKDYNIVLGTSSKLDRACKILKSNQIEDLFDAIVVGYDVERSKPFPDIFLKAAEKVGSKPEECLVLEDSEAGIQAAYAAGIPVICVPDLKQPSEEYKAKTAAIVETLYDVIDYLKEA